MAHRAVFVVVVGLVVAGCNAGSPGSDGPTGAPPAGVERTAPTAPPTTTTTTTVPTTTTTLPPAQVLAALVDATLADLDDYWSEELPATFGVAYRPLATVGGYDVADGAPVCGDEELAPEVARGNAFYCPADDSVGWDAVDLFPSLFTDFGPFAASLVLAHEWGHAVQARVGVPTNLPTIVRELQADCFAGAWAGYALDGRGRVEVTEGDLDIATAGFLLFRDPTGTSAAQPGAHGNAFDRIGAFLDGVRGGASTCATYATEFPPITQRPFLSPEDEARGGDMPFDEVLPLLAPTLEVYWAEEVPAAGGTWVPVSALVAYEDGEPLCTGPVGDPESVAAGVAHCLGDGSVHVDVDGVLATLYDRFGDFGSAYVLALGWSQRAQASLGLASATPSARLQADCLTGTWAAAAADGISVGVDDQGAPIGGALSPGDLDEAIQAILFLGDTRVGAGAFERVGAFRSGFLGGTAACLGG